ncbi:MAG: hypothetical protein R3261_00455, partial [Alphaproteobacteria bacterium]|nr:hypothetical protein [Alphaproteobacteria bacterium]
QERVLEFLAQNWPQSREDYMYIMYHLGHVKLSLGKVLEANKVFERTKHLFNKNSDRIISKENSELYSLFRQCVNLISPKELSVLAKPNMDMIDAMTGPVLWRKPVIASDIIGLVGADYLYVKEFGPNFFKALSKYWPEKYIFHLHVADVPESEVASLESLIDDWSSPIQINISYSYIPEEYKGSKSAYYASLRFFMLPALLEKYGGAVFTFDIDMIAKSDLSPILDTGIKFDYCRYKRPNYGPGGQEYAALTCFNGNAGIKLANLTANIIASRMNESNKHLWFVDQTALYQAYSYIATNSPVSHELNDGNFTDHIKNLDFYFDHLSAEDIKISISKTKV